MASEERIALWNRGFRDAATVGMMDPFLTSEEFDPYSEGYEAGLAVKARTA